MAQPATARDLVLGLVHGYTADRVWPFLDSLRRVVPEARVLLACGAISRETAQALRARGCELLPYRYLGFSVGSRRVWGGNTRWTWLHTRYAAWVNALPLLSGAARLRLRARIAREFVDPNTRRFLDFFLHLEDGAARYDRILVSDLRDVVFQADPFALVGPGEILFGLEDERLTIGTQWANSLWLERVAGPAVKAALADRRISCVGVSVGAADAVIEYLRRLAEVLTAPGCNVANFHGADTGAHNKVVYQDPLPGTRFGDARLGGIINMHGLREEDFRWTEDGLLCDPQGLPYAIVHQYDRHPAVHARLRASLGFH